MGARLGVSFNLFLLWKLNSFNKLMSFRRGSEWASCLQSTWTSFPAKQMTTVWETDSFCSRLNSFFFFLLSGTTQRIGKKAQNKS